jgi:hypothetical protein
MLIEIFVGRRFVVFVTEPILRERSNSLSKDCVIIRDVYLYM